MSEIQDEIQRLQQKMDEGQRNMREEMRAREEAERRRKQERREREEVARSPHKKKIRVRVEQGRRIIQWCLQLHGSNLIIQQFWPLLEPAVWSNPHKRLSTRLRDPAVCPLCKFTQPRTLNYARSREDTT